MKRADDEGVVTVAMALVIDNATETQLRIINSPLSVPQLSLINA